ncbi:sensor domain-containing phosphodiesterase [Klebsiella huaxiensis]|uniref:Cyclic di-GMP phosphodiesterase YfgF n=3 Tax=Klebsiella huaxiensis TaxID=2153354 RepID=A0A564J5S0_9ENTR|nr:MULTISPECIES: EAL domain-containing protein [Klebsiella]MDG1644732.1 EAL domain-containing protein [Klebsiella huaxiensis]QBG07061.1 sensor domain-containing phosphodiesterase [Klebsiella huaxiensis]VUS52165.1 Cyclic di-GMP phosphodiesterase YfgF [Klebsiella huaxiensis]VUS56556.1 Cyclic di-GMP phosphodiesterase YfgF [Klebsiella huaxiensis]
MRLIKLYRQYRDKWWALPLVLPTFLLPVSRWANTVAVLNGNDVFLYYLPLGLVLSLMLFFGWAALPGIVLGLLLSITYGMTAEDSVGVIFHFLIPAVLCWGGYRIFVPRRQQISHGNVGLMPHRLFWQMLLPSLIFLVLSQLAEYLGIHPRATGLLGVNPFSLRTLIAFQALMVGCLTGIPLCYFLIRIIRNPLYIRGFISQVRLQIDPKIKCLEIILWAAALLVLLILLLMPLNSSSTIFSTNYTLSLLMPVILWGAMRFGYRFISLIWPPVLIVIIHFHYQYLPLSPIYNNQLAITSSSYLVFSFIIAYMAMLATQQRAIYARVRRMAFLDPVVHLPNLRALSRALNHSSWSVLCLLRIPELEILGRHYGVLLRIQYKQQLAESLGGFLMPGEDVYQMAGHELVVRLNSEDHQQRIPLLYEHLKKFRFVWNGMPLQPPVGFSYCNVRSPVVHLHLLLGELNSVADLSLATGSPENLQRRGAINLQQELKDKVTIMNQLVKALEQDRFLLMAQPIVGIRGDSYHEVLLRMLDDSDKIIMPDVFLPVAYEFGLSARIDSWVLEHTLIFMDKQRKKLPGMRLAINISPFSVSNSHFHHQVKALLERYDIEPWQIIFELTENHSLTNPEQARQTLAHLQDMGCRVAIDDFGTGYASYARLKTMNADLLKIDGSFIRNLLTSSLDYQAVASICLLARMKNMQVVAEYVETAEIRQAVISLGIDYMQGYDIGKPAPLERLADG